jgi:hypothetical protein
MGGKGWDEHLEGEEMEHKFGRKELSPGFKMDLLLCVFCSTNIQFVIRNHNLPRNTVFTAEDRCATPRPALPPPLPFPPVAYPVVPVVSEHQSFDDTPPHLLIEKRKSARIEKGYSNRHPGLVGIVDSSELMGDVPLPRRVLQWT